MRRLSPRAIRPRLMATVPARHEQCGSARLVEASMISEGYSTAVPPCWRPMSTRSFDSERWCLFHQLFSRSKQIGVVSSLRTLSTGVVDAPGTIQLSDPRICGASSPKWETGMGSVTSWNSRRGDE